MVIIWSKLCRKKTPVNGTNTTRLYDFTQNNDNDKLATSKIFPRDFDEQKLMI